MVRTAEAQADAQAYQPDRQLRQAASSGPRRAVVDVDALRQTVLRKRLHQCRLHAFSALVGQCQQQDVVARVVVKDGQWVAAPAIVHPDVPLEVHLPQGIGVGMLKAQLRCGGLARLDADAPVAVQDVGDGAGGDGNLLAAFEQMGDFAPAPGRMGITHGKHLRFKRRIAAFGAVFRATWPVFDAVAFKPFVGGFAANAEATAKLADVAVRQACQGEEFAALLGHGRGSLGHRFSPSFGTVKVLPMSPHMCHPCLRTCVTHVCAHVLPMSPGLYRVATIVYVNGEIVGSPVLICGKGRALYQALSLRGFFQR